MPLYEYKCHKCGEQFEVMQKFSDEPLTTHEQCGGEVERLLSTPALQFKGSGWYVNDYGRSGSGGGGSKKSDSNGSKSETKSSDSGSSSSTSSGSTTSSDKK